MKDNNRPDGLWGEVYDKETGSKFRSNIIDRPVVALWKEIDVTKLLNEVNNHYERNI